MKKKKGYYSISAVSDMFGIHQQTIRMYERQGLISPKRSDGNIRLFDEEDIERLEQILHYTNKMGVNLAGVEIIIKMQQRIHRLQKDLEKQMKQLFNDSEQELEQEKTKHLVEASQARDQLKTLKKKTKRGIKRES
jgi:MerR family transcriptional regulator/heat shock protein HspR